MHWLFQACSLLIVHGIIFDTGIVLVYGHFNFWLILIHTTFACLTSHQ